MPIVICFTLIIIVLVQISKHQGRDSRKIREEFLEQERASHFVPKKDISHLDYLSIAYEALPFRFYRPVVGDAPARLIEIEPEIVADSPDSTETDANLASLSEELAAVEYEICELAGKQLLNLTGISNTELCLTYGTANLEPLSECDQNFTTLIRALQKWGSLLASAARLPDAVTVLSYAVEIGSDITGTYAVLARIYRGLKQYDKIRELRESAERLNTLMKPSIIKDLDSLIEISDELSDLFEED